jgi:hypothetical protein
VGRAVVVVVSISVKIGIFSNSITEIQIATCRMIDACTPREISGRRT